MVNKQFQPKNLNAQIVEQLGKRIIQGHYKEGEQLPIEADLCIEFGVSRPILREATKILSAKGLLASRPRVGTVVKKRACWNLLDAEVLGWLTQALPASNFLDMLFEARMAIEPSAAELATVKASEDDIRVINMALNDMKFASTPEESIEPDIRFHQAVLDATHNDVIRYIGHTLHNALAISIQLTNWHPDIHKASIPRHEAIAHAIENREAKEANLATQTLLKESRLDFDAKE